MDPAGGEREPTRRRRPRLPDSRNRTFARATPLGCSRTTPQGRSFSGPLRHRAYRGQMSVSGVPRIGSCLFPGHEIGSRKGNGSSISLARHERQEGGYLPIEIEVRGQIGDASIDDPRADFQGARSWVRQPTDPAVSGPAGRSVRDPRKARPDRRLAGPERARDTALRGASPGGRSPHPGSSARSTPLHPRASGRPPDWHTVQALSVTPDPSFSSRRP